MQKEDKEKYHATMMKHARAWIMAKTMADQRGEDLGEHADAFNYLSAAYLDLYKEHTGIDPWDVDEVQLQEELTTLMSAHGEKEDEEVTD